jgi:type II secretory pathway pseudopilin PulG
MTRVQYFISLAVGVLCLVFSVLLLVTGQSAVKTQTRLAQQQEEINRGSVSQQVGQNLLRDMGQVALVNERVRQLLAENGYSINYTPPTTNAATAPAPAAATKK